MNAPIPADESQRIEALRRYAILDTPSESAYDDLTLLASHLCQTPIALVSLVDEARQWFKSRVGLAAQETHRDVAFCAHAILHKGEVLEVRDARLDPRFADNPLVTADPNIRFYAGTPLIDHDGYALGTLCVIDRQPRTLSEPQKLALQALGRHVMVLIENRKVIATQRAIEAELRQMQRQHERILASIGDGLHCIDRSGMIIDENPAAMDMLGYDRAQGLLGQHAHTLMHHTRADGSPYPVSECPIYATLRDGKTRRIENEVFWRKDGTSFRVTYICTAVRDEAGNIERAIVVFHDVTEAAKAREALEQFKYTLDQTDDCVFICRADDFRIVYVNDGAVRQVGYSEPELYALSVPDIKPDYSPEAYRRRVQPLLDGSKSVLKYQTTHQHKDGHTIPVEVTTQAVRLDSVEPRLISVVRDITERKRIEAELVTAKDHAQAADRLKSAFLAAMSHELRTPLNSIIGFTGILLQGLSGAINPEQRKQLDMVQGSARHLLALINDVLDISKIEAEELKVDSAPFDLGASIAKVVGMARPLAERKGLALRVELAPPLGVVGDLRRAEQVLLNLLSNAIKFTERGDIVLTAMRQPEAVEVRVSDTGMGIEPEDLQKLFLPFRQIDAGLARNHEGTGLGLAISKRLVELMGGEIHVESEYGRGSTFSFTLPPQGQEIS